MRGFTLLEVLIALLVVSVTLAAAYAAIGGAAARQRGLEDRTFATWAAQSALARLRLDGFAGDSTQREHTEGGRRLRVSVQVEPGDRLRQVTLTVRPAGDPGQAGEVLATLSGFLPLPVWDEPGLLAPIPEAPPDASDRAATASAPPPDLAP